MAAFKLSATRPPKPFAQPCRGMWLVQGTPSSPAIPPHELIVFPIVFIYAECFNHIMKKLFLLAAFSSFLLAGCVTGGAVVGVEATPAPAIEVSQLPSIDSQYWQVKGATLEASVEAPPIASASPIAIEAATPAPAATLLPTATPLPTVAAASSTKVLCGDVAKSVVLSSNVAATGEGNCLSVTADGVEIDCKGKTIFGSGAAGVFVNGKSNVAIKNCKFEGFKSAIILQGAANAKISGNEVKSFTGENAFSITESSAAMVEKNVVTAASGNAINLENSASAIVSGNTLSSIAKTGVGIRSNSAATDASGNKVSGFGSCIALMQAGSVASANTLENCDKAVDIVLGAAEVKGNTISNSNTGVQAGGDGNSVKQNTITGSRSDGIILFGIQNLVAGNKVCGSGSSDLFALNAPQQGNNDNTCRPGKCGPGGAAFCSGSNCAANC